MTNRVVQFSIAQPSSALTCRTKPQRYYKELKDRTGLNKPAWLLVIYAIAVASSSKLSTTIEIGLVTRPETSHSLIDTQISTSRYHAVSYGRTVILYLFVLCMGWVSDIKLGRGRAINLSLWLCWWGVLIEMTSLCVQYSTSGLPVDIAKYGLSVIALLIILLGFATFLVNMLAYGLDQLVDESNTKIRAFIHWLIWGLFVGFTFDFIPAVRRNVFYSKSTLIAGLAIFGLNTLAVCINSQFSNSFKPSGVLSDNPYKLVFNVLAYAYKHKKVKNRSAFTYWESETPNRISMAKQKYGGPFPDESVENVKTFLRIIAVCLTLFGFYIPFFVSYGQVEVNQFQDSTTSLNGYGSFVLWSSCDKIVLILVPLYELILVPLFPKIEYFFLAPLRWLGISYVLLLLSLGFTFILGVAGEIVTPENVDCTLQTAKKFNISFLYFVLPLSLYGFADMISLIYGLEFIGSQTPINTSGMLTAMFWIVRGIYTQIGRGLVSAFSHIKNSPGDLSCNFWMVLFQIVLCVVGFIIYVRVAKWYQHRIRNDQSDRSIIEEEFNRRLSSNDIEEVQSSQNQLADGDYNDYLLEYNIETVS